MVPLFVEIYSAHFKLNVFSGGNFEKETKEKIKACIRNRLKAYPVTVAIINRSELRKNRSHIKLKNGQDYRAVAKKDFLIFFNKKDVM